MVVPSAFHANEGATGIRKLYLQQTRIEQCLSFENRNGCSIFTHAFKFALVVARRPGPTRTVRCSFYLTEFAQIDDPARALDYDMDVHRGIRRSLRDAAGVAGPRRRCSWRDECWWAIRNLAKWTEVAGISLSREMHMTDDAGRFTRDFCCLPECIAPRSNCEATATAAA